MMRYLLVALFFCLCHLSRAQEKRMPVNDTIAPSFEQMIDECYEYWINAIREDAGSITYVDSIYFRNDFEAKTFPDSVYLERLDKLTVHTPIHLSYNPVVRNYIEMYTGKRSCHLATMLGVSEYYFPIFEEKLAQHQMPLELKYLPVIESALNPVARSRVGASGLWQFMYTTGRQYKLEITSYIDQRLDPYKATDAAVRFLGDLYNIYQDWILVIAAYNCGPGNVNKAIRRSGGKRNYWDIYYNLPKETRGYVPAFFGAMYAFNYYEEHGVHPIAASLPLSCDTLVVPDAIHFDQISHIISISNEELRAINPQYFKDIIPAGYGKEYILKLPYNNIMEYIDKQDSIYTYNRKKYFDDSDRMANPKDRFQRYAHVVSVSGDMTRLTYVVKAGDVPGGIASKFGVRVSDLKYWNNLNRNMTIRVGQRLYIYVPQRKAASVARQTGTTMTSTSKPSGKAVTPEPEPIDGEYFYYTVRSGDNLWSIARQYPGISNTDIMKWNGITQAGVKDIKPGQKLKIKKIN